MPIEIGGAVVVEARRADVGGTEHPAGPNGCRLFVGSFTEKVCGPEKAFV
ncbi:MAG: hypothetical protein U0235_33520 [Polyangiaceae bacterium]